jgi:hypothetical protein
LAPPLPPPELAPPPELDPPPELLEGFFEAEDFFDPEDFFDTEDFFAPEDLPFCLETLEPPPRLESLPRFDAAFSGVHRAIELNTTTAHVKKYLIAEEDKTTVLNSRRNFANLRTSTLVATPDQELLWDSRSS